MNERLKMKRQREEERGRLSELLDCVLLHVMEFMHIKYVVQTCILSKWWKDLWKRLTNLSFRPIISRGRIFKEDNSIIFKRVINSSDQLPSIMNLCLGSCLVYKVPSPCLNFKAWVVFLHKLPTTSWIQSQNMLSCTTFSIWSFNNPFVIAFSLSSLPFNL